MCHCALLPQTHSEIKTLTGYELRAAQIAARQPEIYAIIAITTAITYSIMRHNEMVMQHNKMNNLYTLSSATRSTRLRSKSKTDNRY